MASAPSTAPTPWAVTKIDVVPEPPWKMSFAIAGMSAMNGDAQIAMTAPIVSAVRQPTSALATRTPLAMRCQSVSSPRSIGDGTRMSVRAIITAPNDAALIPNAHE